MNIPKYDNLLRSELMNRFYAKTTKDTYSSVFRAFLRHFEGLGVHEPQKITNTQIRAYFTSIADRGQVSYYNQLLGVLKIFFPLIGQTGKPKGIKRPRKRQFFPIILNQDEIIRLFMACNNVKHKAIMVVMYACGLRVSEVINLKIADINRDGTILIRNSKGNKSRLVPVDDHSIALLRGYYLQYDPKEYLFNGQFSRQYSPTSIRAFLRRYAAMAGITKKVYPHLIRHSSLTHYLEGGTDLRVIQAIAGHKKPETTAGYAHVSPVFIAQQSTPINNIYSHNRMLNH